jgi:hypothetical protein
MSEQANRTSKKSKPRKRRTSWNGWRMVAGGAFLLIFGFSFLTNSFGPAWFALLMMLGGIGLSVYGRRH